MPDVETPAGIAIEQMKEVGKLPLVIAREVTGWDEADCRESESIAAVEIIADLAGRLREAAIAHKQSAPEPVATTGC